MQTRPKDSRAMVRLHLTACVYTVPRIHTDDISAISNTKGLIAHLWSSCMRDRLMNVDCAQTPLTSGYK